MKHKLFPGLLPVLVLCLLPLSSDLQAQDSAFTYQGRLDNNGLPATGAYDVTFALFNDANSGTQISYSITNSIVLSNGLFTAVLDFGPQFNGFERWLQIGARTNGAGVFSLLSPRQKLMTTPYASYAQRANTAT